MTRLSRQNSIEQNGVIMEIEEALQLICENIAENKNSIEVPLYDAYGMVCAEDVVSKINVPSFPKSAMDGYAVKAEDVKEATTDKPVKLKVVGELFAGDYSNIVYSENSAVRVMTGSYVPEGYDSVVMQENTDYGTEEVEIYSSINEYANYCHIGENIKIDDVLIKKGELIDEIKAGIIASAGIGSVKVMAPLSVTIIATGSELMEAGEEQCEGKIYDSISYILMGRLKKLGITFNPFLDYVIADDDEDSIMSEIENRLQVYDVIITTGGVSVGKKDLLKKVLEKLSANIIVSDVNIKPGTPTMVSELEGKVILSLSGNPYAALANFDLYFNSLFAKSMGCSVYDNKVVDAILKTPYDKVDKKRRLVRAYYKDGNVYIKENSHASSVISNLINCNCYIDLKEGVKANVGDTVRVRLF